MKSKIEIETYDLECAIYDDRLKAVDYVIIPLAIILSPILLIIYLLLNRHT